MNKISRQLFSIAHEINRLAANYQVDKSQHTFGQLATLIVASAQQSFQLFLNKNDLDRTDLKSSGIYISLQKDKIELLVQFDPKNNEKLQLQEDKVEKANGIYKSICQIERNGVVHLISSVDTNKFLPLLRSVPGSYDLDNGNLTDEAVVDFRKALYKIAQQKYK